MVITDAVRRVYGEPASVGDYVWQGHLATADQHRAMFEVVNHRLWNITSGFTQWKINSAWADVQWQIFDKQEKMEVGANAYRDVFELPQLPDLPPVYFVRLDLSDATGKRVSDNLYWLPAQKGGSMQALHSLPPVRLQVHSAQGSLESCLKMTHQPALKSSCWLDHAPMSGQGGTGGPQNNPVRPAIAIC